MKSRAASRPFCPRQSTREKAGFITIEHLIAYYLMMIMLASGDSAICD